MTCIGIIGLGQMGSALAKAIRKSDDTVPLLLNRRHLNQSQALAQEVQGELVPVNRLLQEADIILMAIKPNQVRSFFKDHYKTIQSLQGKLWLSVAAGVSLTELQELTPSDHQWIRLMPNTSIEIGKGLIAYTGGDSTSQSILDKYLKASGSLVPISEDKFPAFTALAGCGPAYIYILIEAMSDAGVHAGLSRQEALAFACQVVEGAGAMVKETRQHPALLKDGVTSPGGATIQGVRKLEEAGLRSAIIEAILASSQGK